MSLYWINVILSNEEKPDVEVQAGGGGGGGVWVRSHNAPLCLHRSATYGPILPHPRTSNFNVGLNECGINDCSGAAVVQEVQRVNLRVGGLIPCTYIQKRGCI